VWRATRNFFGRGKRVSWGDEGFCAGYLWAWQGRGNRRGGISRGSAFRTHFFFEAVGLGGRDGALRKGDTVGPIGRLAKNIRRMKIGGREVLEQLKGRKRRLRVERPRGRRPDRFPGKRRTGEPPCWMLAPAASFVVSEEANRMGDCGWNGGPGLLRKQTRDGQEGTHPLGADSGLRRRGGRRSVLFVEQADDGRVHYNPSHHPPLPTLLHTPLPSHPPLPPPLTLIAPHPPSQHPLPTPLPPRNHLLLPLPPTSPHVPSSSLYLLATPLDFMFISLLLRGRVSEDWRMLIGAGICIPWGQLRPRD